MEAVKLAIVQLFTSLTTLFSAVNKIALTVDNLATVASESSGGFMDQARIDRLAAKQAANKVAGLIEA